MNPRISLSYKALDLTYTYGNDVFLELVGYNSVDDVIGLSDTDFCWYENTTLYNHFEADLLAGKQYSTIALAKTYKGELWLFGNKYLNFDEKGCLIGTITNLMEVINPQLGNLAESLKKSNLKNGVNNFVFKIGNQSFNLTKREEEIIFYILRNKAAKTIASILNISTRTVEHHIENIKSKFNCRTKTDLILTAMDNGFMNVIPNSIFSKNLAQTM